jgi:mannose-6-phosphate isomerase-like protein (cupin superfamily)
MKKTFEFLKSAHVPKGWGHELHIVNNNNYCLKFLVFNKGKKFSMHYHLDKTETWYVSQGEFKLYLLNTDNAFVETYSFKEGHILTLHPGQPHQLEAIIDSIIIEVSTYDQAHDNYRVFPGDSQK